ncbi:serine hydrolase domain-containing protein [Salinicoccus roseus]|uniref:serine hydrolase domain-containing protein n=1 Tax=Salinicoccus roseus TaxID=45670 RepID=UPI001EF4BD64|nr:serine hydrolase domain-containing protein [Salinicoccus roseus]MCG7333607.1 beta-lactamase family protein [Salinicoccus roseus]
MITQSKIEAVNQLLNDQCEILKIPGMALSVMKDGVPVYEKYHGFRNVAEKLPVTPETVFGLASLTKSLTSYTVMHLESEGLLKTSDQVSRWIPELKWPDDRFTGDLTINHLMSHTSGLPGLPVIHHARLRSITEDPDGDILFSGQTADKTDWIDSSDELITQLNRLNIELLGIPGEVFNYSNEGYGLLQTVIENASGMPFTEYVAVHIFKPEGMNDSYFLNQSLDGLDNVTELYAYAKNKSGVFHSPHWWDVGDIYTNGSWKASVNDVLAFAEILRTGRGPAGEAAADKMTAPFISLPNGGDYGFGIELNPIGKDIRFGHGGSIKGVSSNFQVVKNKGISAVILINMADVPAEKILTRVLNIILDVPETSPLKDRTLLSTDEIDLEKYTGDYASDEGPAVQVDRSADALSLDRSGEVALFYPYTSNDFISESGERIYFSLEKDTVKSVMLGKRVLSKTMNVKNDGGTLF